jgi:hypothetical protein
MENNNNIFDNNIIENKNTLNSNLATKNDLYNTEYILFKKVSIVEKYNFYEYLSVMID